MVVSLAQQKQIAVDWLRALFVGDVATFKKYIHPDFESVIIGDLPFAAKRSRDEFLAFLADFRAEEFAPEPFTFTLGAITAEDGRVCMEAESRIKLRNGKVYNNHYMLTVIVQDELVISLKEFGDSHHVHKVLSNPKFTTESKERQNLMFDEPSHVFTCTA